MTKRTEPKFVLLLFSFLFFDKSEMSSSFKVVKPVYIANWSCLLSHPKDQNLWSSSENAAGNMHNYS